MEEKVGEEMCHWGTMDKGDERKMSGQVFSQPKAVSPTCAHVTQNDGGDGGRRQLDKDFFTRMSKSDSLPETQKREHWLPQ